MPHTPKLPPPPPPPAPALLTQTCLPVSRLASSLCVETCCWLPVLQCAVVHVEQVCVCVCDACLSDVMCKRLKSLSAFAVVVNAPCSRPVVPLPPSPTSPHRQDGVSVHSGSRERERRCGDSGGGRRHLGRGSQPPLVLKPETTRSDLIYRERRGRGGGRDGEGGKERWGGGMQEHQIKTLMFIKRIKKSQRPRVKAT